MGYNKSSSKGKFIAIQAYLNKQEKCQIKKLNFLPKKKLEKEQQSKPKFSRRKKKIKIRVEINETETKKTEKISITKSWFFENINKIDKL